MLHGVISQKTALFKMGNWTERGSDRIHVCGSDRIHVCGSVFAVMDIKVV
jgi:hypothetical protein